jgi:hypothetical protein
VIPRRLMTPDTSTVLSGIHNAGDAAPLKIYKPGILTLTMIHATPWPSRNNTLTVIMKLNVPLLLSAFAPRITISNLVWTLTPSGPLPLTISYDSGGVVNTSMHGAFDQAVGALVFVPPYDTVAGRAYTITFALENRKCERTAPVTRMSITGICFDHKDVDRLTYSACNTLTRPLEVLGGPCGVGAASAARFTLKNISQSTPYPGCNNTITVEITTSIPLSHTEQAAIEIDFADSLEIGTLDGPIHLGGADRLMFFGGLSNETGTGMWNRATNMLILNVAEGQELLACTLYIVTITVVNPLQVESPPPGIVLQAAQAVRIRALGTVAGTAGQEVIQQTTMDVDMLHAPITLPGTNAWDTAPMLVYKPTFLHKTVLHTSPYPGANNTIKVTISTNTNLRRGSLIAIHNVKGAIAVSGSMSLTGADAVMFESLDGTASRGTWNDCQKALILKVKTDLGCAGTSYVISFNVQNPIEPQLCAEVMINATGISKHPGVYGEQHASITNDNRERVPAVWDGEEMQADKSSRPTGIYGALGEDACPMTVWPGAFLVKDIGQNNAHPCGLNTITVTISTNVPLYPVVQYPGRPAIRTDIIISRMKGAIQDVFSPSGSRSIALLTQQKDPCNAAVSNVVLFADVHGNASMASWSDGPEATITLRRAENQADCCVPGPERNEYTFSFNVYNPAIPQDPTFPVSITATGIPIELSAMRDDVGELRPMYVKAAALIIKSIQQSSAFPCASNTISVTLKLNVNLYTRCNAIITLTGFQNVTLVPAVSAENATLVPWETGSSNAGQGKWYGDSSIGVLMMNASQLEVVSSTQTMSFSFNMTNPYVPVTPTSSHFVTIKQIGLAPTALTYPETAAHIPITVIQPTFTTAEIVQSNPYPAALNTITVTLRSNVPLPGSCSVRITISNLEGACVESADNVVQLQGTGANAFGLNNTAAGAASALWDPSSKSVTLHTVGSGMESAQTYTFQFIVRNPTMGQSSPLVMVRSSSIAIAPTSMVKNPASIVPPNIFQGSVKESEPMEVRGSQTAASFTKMKIGQSVILAGQTNEITVTLQTNVPLTASSPVTTVTIKSLTGAVATNGQPPVGFQVTNEDGATGTFNGLWVAATSALKLTVAVADTTPGKDYVIKFSVANPRRAQSSPALTIEASGIVIQPAFMVRAPHDTDTNENHAPMYVKGPELINREVFQTLTAPWPGQENLITVRFTPTVDLIPRIGSRLSIIISGLEGVDGVANGSVAIQGADAGNFSSCQVHASNCSLTNSTLHETHNSEGIWNEGSKALELRVANILTKDKQVEIQFKFTNALVGQDPPQIMIGMTSNYEQFDIAPAVAHPPAIYRGTDQEALLIYPSVNFTVKAIGQARSTPGATNTITATFQPQFALTGAKNSTITISGLKGSMTPDKPIKLLDSDSKFNSVAAWDSKAGKLVLTVAPGQVVPAGSETTIKFELLNPKYPQSGPAVIEISASGDVPIAAEAMVLASGELQPLKVVAAQFSSLDISGTSNAPGAWNTITATFRPSVLLSKGRNSVITIDGLSGSATKDTDFLPITMVSGSTAAFVSPAGSFSLGFSSQCSLSDNRIVFDMGLNSMGSEDPTGSILYFTAGGCKDRWTRISAYNKTTHCATLNTTAGNWFDGLARCTSLGEIKNLTVVAGGEAYRTGAFEVWSPEGGTGLSGNCTVDEFGVVKSVSILTPGYGYGPKTIIKCPRACQSTGVCSVSGSSPVVYTDAEVGFGIEHDSAAMSAAEWRQGSGTLKLAVRDEQSISADTVVSFKIRNSMQPQPAQAAFIKASGRTPIGSHRMTGDVMRIDGTSTTLTRVCTNAAGECTTSFTGLPTTGVTLYTLSAEIQCNAKATSVVVKVGAVDQPVDQPPATCSDACNEYHRLFSHVDVTSKVTAGSLAVETTASGVSTDHCGAGENLKVVFILSYTPPP